MPRVIMHSMVIGFALGWMLIFTTEAVAQSATPACSVDFDQTFEWDDGGYLANGMRNAVLADGIANDPGPGPVELNPTLAEAGAPGFTRGGERKLIGFSCVDQTFAPTGNAPGPRVEACLLDLPRNCENRLRLKPLETKSTIFDGNKVTVVRNGRTTALQLGSVDRRVFTPPPSARPLPEDQPPGMALCDCRNPEQNCSAEQRRACERSKDQ